jgi:branched-chain amino acid transport system permease protein
MEFFIMQTFNGISYAALLFLIGGGLSIIFGVMNIVNVTQGSFFLVGGYIGYVVVSLTGNFYLAILGAIIVVSVIGMVMESVFLRRLSEPYLDLRQMLITMGFALFLQDLCLILFGGYTLDLPPPDWCAKSIKIGPYSFYVLRLFMMGAAALTYVVLYWFQEKTLAGAVLRASVDNREMAQGLGINVDFVTMAVFGLGACLAAFGGVIGCSFTAVYPGVDWQVLPLAFVVVIVGGMGSIKGALIGAIIVGLLDNWGKALIPELSYFTIFAPMAIILAVKPTGFFGKETSKLA